LLMACVSIGIIQAIAVKQNAISTSQTDEEWV
jgi:hypothetical protein